MMYSFSLKSIIQHTWSPVRLLNLLTSVSRVTKYGDKEREREEDT